MRITLPEPKRFSKVFKAVTTTYLAKTITGISTDSRECIEGDLYIAIKGDNLIAADLYGQRIISFDLKIILNEWMPR